MRSGTAVGSDVQLIGAQASAILPVAANAAVPRGIAWAPFNQGGSVIETLIDASASVTDVKIEVM